MWTLKALDVGDYRTHLDIAFPNEEIPEYSKQLILKYYSWYLSQEGRPSALLMAQGTSEELREKMLKAYDLVSENGKLKNLRAELKLLSDVCPYCGFAPVSQLDHLLQKAHFNLFSIFPHNLIPSCQPCNGGKRQKPSALKSLDQIHVYLEDLSGWHFFHARAAIDKVSGGLALTYYVRKCKGMSDEIFERLEQHLTEFKLNTKYSRQVNILLGEIGFTFASSFRVGGASAVRATLLDIRASYKVRFGRNDWRTATIKALAKCYDFCDGGFVKAIGAPNPRAA